MQPPKLSLMRSSALPISHTNTRMQAATLLRLSRIINFAKELENKHIPMPAPQPYVCMDAARHEGRMEKGQILLSRFLHDGRIRGMTPDGDMYEHPADLSLTHRMLSEWQPGSR